MRSVVSHTLRRLVLWTDMENKKTRMNDIQVADAISAEIGQHYKEARSNCSILPKYALNCFRVLASVICELIAVGNAPKGTLSEQIDLMLSGKILDKSTAYRLHELRDNGNKGTHPEQYREVDFDELALRSETAAIELIKTLYRLKVGKLPNDIEIADVASSELHRLGYLAMFQRDVDAMYRAGLYLQQRAEKESDGSGIIRADGYLITAAQDIEQAVLWFKCAAKEGHAGAMYQYGRYRSTREYVAEDPLYVRQEGERYLYQASEKGDADALCAMGDLYYEGSALHDQDYGEAITFFQKAAELKHPTAMASLGYMYSAGLGCEPDPQAAANMSLLAAKAGFPQAQYNVCQHYLKGNGIEQSEKEGYKWLEAAADQGYQHAQFLIAQLMIVGMDWPKYDARSLLESAVQNPDLHSQALFSLAKLERKNLKGLQSWINAAGYIQESYAAVVEEDDCHHIGPQVVELGKEVVSRLRAHVKSAGPRLDGSDLFACCLFHLSGVPLTREERNQWYIEWLDLLHHTKDDTLGALALGQMQLSRRAGLS